MKRILFILMIVLFTLPLRAGAEEFKSSANIFEELESAQAGSTTMHQLTQKPKTINFVTFPGIFGKQYSEILYFDLKWARNATKKDVMNLYVHHVYCAMAGEKRGVLWNQDTIKEMISKSTLVRRLEKDGKEFVPVLIFRERCRENQEGLLFFYGYAKAMIPEEKKPE